MTSDSHVAMLTEIVRMVPSLDCHKANVDFYEVKDLGAMVGESCLLEKAGSNRRANRPFSVNCRLLVY